MCLGMPPGTAQVTTRKRLSDEVDAVMLLIIPALKALDDVWVEVKPLCHL